MLDLNKLKNVAKALAVRKHNKTVISKKGTVYVYGTTLQLFRKAKKAGYNVIDKAWDKFEEQIRKEFKEGEADSIIANARRIRNDIEHGKAQYSSELQKGKNRIDVSSLVSRLATDSASKYLLNMGMTPSEVIEYVKAKTGKTIKQAELLNPGNWHDDTWNGPVVEGGRLTLKIKFSYNGTAGIEIIV